MAGRPGIDQALFLFDIDGTLLRGSTAVHRDAFRHAFETVYGVPLSLDGISAAGRTDMWLLAEPLRRTGMDPATIRGGMTEAFAVMQEYVDTHLGDLKDKVLPGVPDVLAELRRHNALLGLLTGNLSRIAMAKLRHAGLAQYFDTGGFGEESEVRAHLVPVAMAHASRRAGSPIPASHTVVIGDTPLDIEAGAEHGTRTAGVATGPFGEEILRQAGADLVLSSMADYSMTVPALLALVAD
jgi:phosphoglycolate phosphatase-like HAD superfamily hydrolase